MWKQNLKFGKKNMKKHGRNGLFSAKKHKKNIGETRDTTYFPSSGNIGKLQFRGPTAGGSQPQTAATSGMPAPGGRPE
jgi:hypothetical protein